MDSVAGHSEGVAAQAVLCSFGVQLGKTPMGTTVAKARCTQAVYFWQDLLASEASHFDMATAITLVRLRSPIFEATE